MIASGLSRLIYNQNWFIAYYKIYEWGSILNAFSHGLLYGYMGYLMTNLPAPEDLCRPQKLVGILQS